MPTNIRIRLTRETQANRDAKLYKDFMSSKYSVVQLVAKYRISSARIYQIVNKMKGKEL